MEIWRSGEKIMGHLTEGRDYSIKKFFCFLNSSLNLENFLDPSVERIYKLKSLKSFLTSLILFVG